MSQSPINKVDICNLALDYLGEAASVKSIDAPTTATEQTMGRWYDHVRQICLRDYVWNFAKTYATVLRSGDGVGNFRDAYEFPVDLLRLLRVGQYIDLPVCYDITGRTLLASEGNSIPIQYISNVVDVTLMDALFINFFALRLALKVAYKFTKKKSVTDQLSQLLALDESKASSIDGQERIPIRIQHSKYLRARRVEASNTAASRYVDFS